MISHALERGGLTRTTIFPFRALMAFCAWSLLSYFTKPQFTSAGPVNHRRMLGMSLMNQTVKTREGRATA
jgi:hypothetical protein